MVWLRSNAVPSEQASQTASGRILNRRSVVKANPGCWDRSRLASESWHCRTSGDGASWWGPRAASCRAGGDPQGFSLILAGTTSCGAGDQARSLRVRVPLCLLTPANPRLATGHRNNKASATQELVELRCACRKTVLAYLIRLRIRPVEAGNKHRRCYLWGAVRATVTAFHEVQTAPETRGY